MTEKDNGGPAFPQLYGSPKVNGMTLRDYFAGQALIGIMNICPKEDPEPGEKTSQMFSRKAYLVADAMIAERSK